MGVRCVDGVVLGVEKLILSKMLVKGSNKRIMSCDHHIGMALAGLAADARQVANHAREEAQNYRSFYGNPIPGFLLADRIGCAAIACQCFSTCLHLDSHCSAI